MFFFLLKIKLCFIMHTASIIRVHQGYNAFCNVNLYKIAYKMSLSYKSEIKEINMFFFFPLEIFMVFWEQIATSYQILKSGSSERGCCCFSFVCPQFTNILNKHSNRLVMLCNCGLLSVLEQQCSLSNLYW